MVSLELPMISFRRDIQYSTPTVRRTTDRFPRSRDGFTLSELMLVLAIFAVMASLAIPMLDSMITRSGFKT